MRSSAAPASESRAPVRQGAKSPANQRFDMWLEKQLQAMYEIASERDAGGK